MMKNATACALGAAPSVMYLFGGAETCHHANPDQCENKLFGGKSSITAAQRVNIDARY